jgi:uncharacterized protein YprB with RNaseH-like and TPR domain
LARLPKEIEAYLDIETTGLSPFDCRVTVVGVYLVWRGGSNVIQLVGDDVTDVNLLNALQGVTSLYTYNGSRFDLPFLEHHLGINLEETCSHRDLMYDCWRFNLKGGLKRVEQQLGIPRQLTGIDGFDAIRLWWRYVNDYDEVALHTLLEYNKEDVVNLKTLKERLLVNGL